MANDSIDLSISKFISKMPTLPVSTSKVLQICSSPYANPSDLNNVISLDPVLTGLLLKLINSAYYSLNTNVVSIARAIIMLGINTVKNMALSAAVLSSLPKNKDSIGLNMNGFWLHSLCVGVTSKLLAVKQGVDPKLAEEYFTAGLLHDIGKIPINAVKPAEYLLVVTEADRDQKPLYAAENEALELNHCMTGQMILKAWKLEGSVADAVLCHHTKEGYSGNYQNVVNNVSIANYLACVNEAGFAGDRNPEKPDQAIWDAAGVKEDFFDKVRDKVDKEIEKARVFLNIHGI